MVYALKVGVLPILLWRTSAFECTAYTVEIRCNPHITSVQLSANQRQISAESVCIGFSPNSICTKMLPIQTDQRSLESLLRQTLKGRVLLKHSLFQWLIPGICEWLNCLSDNCLLSHEVTQQRWGESRIQSCCVGMRMHKKYDVAVTECPWGLSRVRKLQTARVEDMLTRLSRVRRQQQRAEPVWVSGTFKRRQWVYG